MHDQYFLRLGFIFSFCSEKHFLDLLNKEHLRKQNINEKSFEYTLEIYALGSLQIIYNLKFKIMLK